MTKPTTKSLLAAAVLAMPPTASHAELSVGNGEILDTYEFSPVNYVSSPEDVAWEDKRASWVSGTAGLLTGLLIYRFRSLRKRRMPAARLVAAMLFPAALGLVPMESNACMNVEATLLDESYLRLAEDNGAFSATVHRARLALPAEDPHAKENPSAYPIPPEPGIKENDAAVREVLAGRYASALQMLKAVEAAHPGLYETAANMGTVFEFTGDNASALHWINEGIKRNPRSHMVAEWLHVKVLEAKVALATDPIWLNTHTITGMDPKKNYFETLQGSKDRKGIILAFRSQCTVRALFIKPQDEFMGRLLYEAATFLAEEDMPAVAATLNLAEEYGMNPTKTDALRSRAKAAISSFISRWKSKIPGASLGYWKYALLFTIAALIGTFLPGIRLKRSGAKKSA